MTQDIRKCDECSEDSLTVTDLVIKVSLGTNLTHTEVEEWATGENENYSMQMLADNKNVLHENDDHMKSGDKANDATDM